MRWFDLDADDPEESRRHLTAHELARVERLATPLLQHRAAVRLATRRLALAADLHVAPGELDLTSDASGRPRVALRAGPSVAQADDAGALDVSFSSSGHVAVLAIARGCRVGIDVELIAPLHGAARLVARIATPSEAAALGDLAAPRRDVAVLGLWARKEACVKATGQGVGAGLRTVDVGADAASTFREARLASTGPWHVLDLTCPIAAAAAALCVSGSHGQLPTVAVSPVPGV